MNLFPYFPQWLDRFFGWIIDRIAGDRELDVEPQDHPYYPGEAFDAEYHDV